MRKYAYLKTPLNADDGQSVFKIMLYEADEGVYLFQYSSPDAVLCSSDLFYPSADEVYEEWNSLIDEQGWVDIGDPLPDCQHDAWIPLRVKGRNTGHPLWGQYETLQNGEWVEYHLPV